MLHILGVRAARRGRDPHSRDFGERTTCPRIDAYIAPYDPRIDAYIAPSGPRIDAYPMTDAGLVEPVRPLALGAGRAVAWPAAHATVRVPCPTPRCSSEVS